MRNRDQIKQDEARAKVCSMAQFNDADLEIVFRQVGIVISPILSA